jgi:3-deoxy-D-arabino-heptulosonate 7-phosphate (DAHP) synthase class II
MIHTASGFSLPAADSSEIQRQISRVLDRPAAQQPEWPEPEFAEAIRMLLAQAPPLVKPHEVNALRDRLADVALGKAFVLQGGDCAETFGGNTAKHVKGNVETLLQMSGILRWTTGLPVISIGRLAGQYAKPRSASTDSSGLPVYRGDLINSMEPSPIGRVSDPARMLSGYANAASTMKIVRDVTDRYAEHVYTSHEALLIDYERALLRVANSPNEARLFGLSGHFLWIGERTRQLEGAHLGLAKIIANPVGVKLGPNTTREQVVRYAEFLNPDRLPGRLTLMSRLGNERVRDVLPGLITAVAASGHQVIWQCDPMHGNTRQTVDGRKTRDFDRIVDEICGFFEVHRALGTSPGGLHLEFTGDDVTECVGGAQCLRESDLHRRYESACDPRLNAHQALEVAVLTAELLAS